VELLETIRCIPAKRRLLAEIAAEIAVPLSVTEETVKAHVKNILAKLGASDRTHAVAVGLKRGILDL